MGLVVPPSILPLGAFLKTSSNFVKTCLRGVGADVGAGVGFTVVIGATVGIWSNVEAGLLGMWEDR